MTESVDSFDSLEPLKFVQHKTKFEFVEILSGERLQNESKRLVGNQVLSAHPNNDITGGKTIFKHQLTAQVIRRIKNITHNQVNQTGILSAPILDINSLFNDSMLNVDVSSKSITEEEVFNYTVKPFSFKQYIDFLKVQKDFNTIQLVITQNAEAPLFLDEGSLHRMATTPGYLDSESNTKASIEQLKHKFALNPYTGQVHVSIVRDLLTSMTYNIAKFVCENKIHTLFALQNLHSNLKSTLSVYNPRLYILKQIHTVPQEIQAMGIHEYEYSLPIAHPFSQSPIITLSLIYNKPYEFYKQTTPVLWHGGSILRGQHRYGIYAKDITLYPRFFKYQKSQIITPYFLYKDGILTDLYSITEYYSEMQKNITTTNQRLFDCLLLFQKLAPENLIERQEYFEKLQKAYNLECEVSTEEYNLINMIKDVFTSPSQFPTVENELVYREEYVSLPPLILSEFQKLYPTLENRNSYQEPPSINDILDVYDYTNLIKRINIDNYKTQADRILSNMPENIKNNIFNSWSVYLQGRMRLGMYNPRDTYTVNLQKSIFLSCDLLQNVYESTYNRTLPFYFNTLALQFARVSGYNQTVWGTDIKPPKKLKTNIIGEVQTYLPPKDNNLF